MDRTRFYKIVNVGGQDELDFLDSTLSAFSPQRPMRYYRVTQADVSVPDNISYKVYGNERYWWIIALVNEISDCCADLKIGQLLKIPDILDIYDYYKRWRVR